MTFAMIIAGLAFLLAGGEALVHGSVAVATRLGISPLMIGLTLVGFGTSAPELFTSVQAALAGSSGIAVGNIVGSNIANILLILGLVALFMPIATQRTALIRDGALLVGSALLFSALCYAGQLGIMAGTVLLAGLAGYLLLLWTQERHKPETSQPETAAPSQDALLPSVAFTIGGIALVMLGARFLVSGAIDLARIWGTPESVIGLTIVAIGTSLPELATSIVAAIRKQPDVAFGNVVGSNIFNVLAIGGTTALVTPLTVPPDMLTFDIPIMIAVSFALVIVAWTGSRIVRLEGAFLLAGFGIHQLLLWT
ncbi:MAG: calcium/sodium antiporter [Rhodobiaceae bacterium]|nr:calcium/sodium antiporter [Rhodobiaceae bacterium]MCB1481397.1 calcium/sodium antiporter [Rhodobiaceae bacterium]MCC0012349.1 calcium/sodium antiporter [Rhodobiaceae bacterium]MCC0019085.1 calcium/sodium antiporter [Rhodobiaceae bacterium]MCC0051933.1 calcium/sodium antiporter [Rhodobiaceae bacterium]